MFRRVLMFAVLFAALTPAAGLAQTGGTVAGLVRDSLGGAIPGATVRVVNEATGAAQETVSDGEGRYRFDDVAPGQYRVEATLDGFEPAVGRGAVDGRQAASIDVTLTPARLTEGVVVTARRVEEAVQEVPIPVSVLSGELVESAGAFNVNRVKELIPTVQFYSSNPRNSAVTIRGIGSPFGLTNDGIEPGVGCTSMACSTRGLRPLPSTSSTSRKSRCCAVHRERCLGRTQRRARSTSPASGRTSRLKPTWKWRTAATTSFKRRRRSLARSVTRWLHVFPSRVLVARASFTTRPRRQIPTP